jgi:uncharacterized protein (TIGR03437 family)
MVAGLPAVPAAAQTFDNSANATLHGNYFVREVLVTNVSANGTVGQAISVIGTATFDGAGNYVFNGTTMDSSPPSGEPQQNTSYSVTGTYRLAANGFLRIESLVGTYIDQNGNSQIDVAFGGAGTAGPNAFEASATEESNYDLLIGIPMNAAVSNASFKGTYNAAYLDLAGADITMISNSTLQQFTANGLGSLGNVAVSGYAANSNSTLLNQTVSGGTYSLSSVTVTGGTMNFGSTASLIGGSMAFMVSPDGALVLGGSLNGYDMLVGTPVVANASDAKYQGFYFLGAIEDDASLLVSQSQSTIDTFYGSSSVTGTGGLYINHLRFDQEGYLPYDYTYNDNYSVPATGIFQPANDPDQYMLGANGQVLIMSGQSTWYSLMVGLQAPNYSGSGVFLNPLGIVNSANWAPATNPVAPLEIAVLLGTGLASTSFKATTLPLPTETPDGVQVLINGAAAPLFAASPTLITVLVPSGISPANGVYYATFQVENNGVKSLPVTMYTNYTAPGVYAISQGGIGDAAALHADGLLITSANPASIAETVELFLTGLGSVTPSVPDGSGAPTSPPFSMVDATTNVYIDDWDSQTPFVGLAPGYTGLDQLNVTMPAVSSTEDWYLGVQAIDPVGLDGGYTVEATLNITGPASPAPAAGAAPAGRPTAAPRPLRAAHHGIPAVDGLRPASGRLPRAAQ